MAGGTVTCHLLPLPWDGVDRRARPREDGPAWTPEQRALLTADDPQTRWAVTFADGSVWELSARNRYGAADRARIHGGTTVVKVETWAEHVEAGKARFSQEMADLGFVVIGAI